MVYIMINNGPYALIISDNRMTTDDGQKVDNEEIRKIRIDSGMTQAAFAQFMGISPKTVEAWECGRIHPTGPAYRLLNLLYTKGVEDFSFVSVLSS